MRSHPFAKEFTHVTRAFFAIFGFFADLGATSQRVQRIQRHPKKAKNPKVPCQYSQIKGTGMTPSSCHCRPPRLISTPCQAGASRA